MKKLILVLLLVACLAGCTDNNYVSRSEFNDLQKQLIAVQKQLQTVIDIQTKTTTDNVEILTSVRKNIDGLTEIANYHNIFEHHIQQRVDALSERINR